MIPITVPFLGLSANDPLCVSCWLVELGEVVIQGDRMVELVSGEITFDVSAPATGRLARMAREVDDVVRPGEVLGSIELGD